MDTETVELTGKQRIEAMNKQEIEAMDKDELALLAMDIEEEEFFALPLFKQNAIDAAME